MAHRPTPDTVDLLRVGSAADWRAWLAEHGATEPEVWLLVPHAHARARAGGDDGDGDRAAGIGIPEAVEQALCFGWIDGLHQTVDATSSRLRFTPRRPRSSWSKVNRDRAERLVAAGLMSEAGQAAIDRAKAAGTWQVLPDHEASTVPADLAALLDADPVARAHFDGFPPSSRRLILGWIAGAKRPDTRRRRVAHTAALAADGRRANHPGAPTLGRA